MMWKTLHPTEEQEQCTVIATLRTRARTDPRLRRVFASMNGLFIGITNEDKSKGSYVTRARRILRAKLAGLEPGVPDIFLAWPVDSYHGLFIEMKRWDGGDISDDQKRWAWLLSSAGYAHSFAPGADVALRDVDTYLTHAFVQTAYPAFWEYPEGLATDRDGDVVIP